jgi:hypothetical protein
MNTPATPDPGRRAARPRSPVLFVLAIAAGLALALAVAVGAAQTAIACKPGLTTINGQPAEVFCGPARATVHVGSQTLHLTGGKCTQAFSRLVVNIGTEILTRATVQRQPYFTASFPLTPGPKNSKPATVAWASGRSHGVSPLVAAEGPPVKYLLRGESGGSFSGVTYPGKQHFAGEFSC